MYGPPEEDGYPDTHKSYSNNNNYVQVAAAHHPNRGADYAPEVVESHGMEHNPSEPRSYPEAVPAPLAMHQSRTPLPEYSSYNNGHEYTHTKEGYGDELRPPGSSHGVVISSGAAQKKRICGVTRLIFFAVLSLLAVALVAVGLGVGLGVGLQHPTDRSDKDSSAAADAAATSFSSSMSGAAIPSPTSTVTPSKNANATCVAGLRYCGWDLIEQHREWTLLLFVVKIAFG
ncbi:hypothetical protein PG984_007020 [Apiospora sp. TS-2023a]